MSEDVKNELRSNYLKLSERVGKSPKNVTITLFKSSNYSKQFETFNKSKKRGNNSE